MPFTLRMCSDWTWECSTKRRDYTRIVDGRNPIVAHEFLGSSVEGKDVIIIDDMISSGDSMIEVATELKRRKANRIFAAATFGLFTNGMEKFDKAYEDGIITGILTTNLIYQTPELLSQTVLYQLRYEQIYRSDHRHAESRRFDQLHPES